MKEIARHLDHNSTRIPYYTWEIQNPKAVLILIHGLKSHSGWFLETGDSFAERGIKVYAFDRRGSGRSLERRGHIEDFHLWLEDLHSIIQLVKRENPDRLPHLLGHCFGAKIALSYLINYPLETQSAILIAPPQNALKADLTLFQKAKVLLSLCVKKTFEVPVPIQDEMFTIEPEKIQFIHEDSLRLQTATTKLFSETLAMDRQIDRNLEIISSPVLVLLAKQDRVVENSAVLKRFFSRLNGRRKAVEVFDCHHDLLFENQRFQVIERISNWVTNI